MKRTLTRLLIISCLLVEGGLNSVAQEKKLIRLGPEDRADGAFKVLGPKLAIGKVVKGAPYSATAITETIQTLSDGNQIIRKNESKLYRDSEGRTRIEQTLETIGKWTADGEPRRHIFINDPVAGVSYSFNPRTRVADKIIAPTKRIAPRAQIETQIVNGQKVTTYTINGETVTQAEFESLKEKKQRIQEEVMMTRGKGAAIGPEVKKKIETLRTGKTDADPGKKEWNKESLGTQTIEGVTVEGTRSTFTIPAGEIGNTLPIEIVDETWYSPELQTTVMTRHRDPRSGETTYRLTNISRSEQDRSLFEIPADYNVVEGKTYIKAPVKKKLPKEEQ